MKDKFVEGDVAIVCNSDKDINNFKVRICGKMPFSYLSDTYIVSRTNKHLFPNGFSAIPVHEHCLKKIEEDVPVRKIPPSLLGDYDVRKK